MKRTAAALLAACLLLTACGGKSPAAPAGLQEEPAGSGDACTPAQVAWALWESQEETPAESRGLAPEDPGFADYLTAYYQLDPETVEDGYLRCAGGMEAFELAVLRFREGTDMEAVQESLESYRDARAGDFTGYLPEQAALVESGGAAVQGRWAALMLCPQPERAREAFLACLDADATPLETPAWPEDAGSPQGEDPGDPQESDPPEKAGSPEEPPTPEGEEAGNPPEPPKEPDAPEETPGPEKKDPEPAPQKPDQTQTPPAPPPDVYDGQAVRTAWASGDDSGLSEKSRAVLDAAREVIRENITSDMSPYDQELAIHDWMLAWGSYDHDTLSHVEGDQGVPDNENPYGFLIRKKGICSGYSSTFQLFMDLLGIECLTVEGTAHNGSSPHAWNLVRLEGEWYGVDVTWDDPSGVVGISAALAHRYFNVTSQFLRSNDHQWTAEVPEAEGTALAWSAPELSLPGA